MTFSSQAGLASIRAGVKIAARPTLEIITLSGIVFTLRKEQHTEGWAVVGADYAGQSANAQSVVGMVFIPGDDPQWYPQGYATIIQAQLNRHER